MSEYPLFSVIVPTRRRTARLARCLDALAELDYPPDRYEVVVVVDGRDDATEAMLAARRELPLRVLRQSQAGPASARNRGAAAAAGDYLAFTDDDCVPDAAWLRTLRERLRADPDALVGGLTSVARSANPYSQASQLVVDALYEYYDRGAERDGFFTTNNMAVAAAAFRELGGFDASFPFAAGEDHEFADRWRQLGRRLVLAPDARVLHAHELGLRTFVRQHFTYGRGTVHLHRARRRRGVRRTSFAPALYALLFVRLPLRHRPPQAVVLSALALATQISYAAGFAYETARPRRRNGC